MIIQILDDIPQFFTLFWKFIIFFPTKILRNFETAFYRSRLVEIIDNESKVWCILHNEPRKYCTRTSYFREQVEQFSIEFEFVTEEINFVRTSQGLGLAFIERVPRKIPPNFQLYLLCFLQTRENVRWKTWMNMSRRSMNGNFWKKKISQ